MLPMQYQWITNWNLTHLQNICVFDVTEVNAYPLLKEIFVFYGALFSVLMTAARLILGAVIQDWKWLTYDDDKNDNF